MKRREQPEQSSFDELLTADDLAAPAGPRRKRTEPEPAPEPVSASHDSPAEPDIEPEHDVAASVEPAEASTPPEIELAALRQRLPEEVYQELVRLLGAEHMPAHWYLQRRRKLITDLVLRYHANGPTTRTDAVAYHVAIQRRQPPADPAAVIRTVAAVRETVQAAELERADWRSVQELLAADDTVSVPLQRGDGAHVIVSRDAVEITLPLVSEQTIDPAPLSNVEVSESPSPPAPDRVLEDARDDIEQPRSEPAERHAAALPSDAAITVELSELLEALPRPEHQADELTEPTSAEIDEAFREAITEQINDSVVEETADGLTDIDRSEPVSTEPPATTLPDAAALMAAVEILERHGVELNQLPPIAGGASTKRPLRRRPPKPYQAPPRHPLVRYQTPLRHVSPAMEAALYHRDRRERPPERPPDHRMKRQARKLVRILARRYGVRLTDRLEQYLIDIVLRPNRIDGRLVYGLRLNRDLLLRTLAVVWLNFGDSYAIRPSDRSG